MYAERSGGCSCAYGGKKAAVDLNFTGAALMKHIQDDCILSLPHGGHASNTSQANDYVPVFMQAQNIHVGTM